MTIAKTPGMQARTIQQPAPNLQQARCHVGKYVVIRTVGPEHAISQGKGLLDDPVLTGLAQKYGKSPAQVVLRWHVQLGNIVFPKSMHAERMRENIDVFDFELAGDDMQEISALDRGAGGRLGPDPDRFG